MSEAVAWVSMQGAERRAAKAAFEAEHPLPVAPLPARRIVTAKNAFVSSGGVWLYARWGKRVARMGAESRLVPTDTLHVDRRGGECVFVGRSGQTYVCLTCDGSSFAASYQAAVAAETNEEQQL